MIHRPTLIYRNAKTLLRGFLFVLPIIMMTSIAEAGGPPITDADDLLNAIDNTSGNLHDFTANMRYTKEQGLLGDIQTRTGSCII